MTRKAVKLAPLSLDIYEPAFNNSGHDEPEAVGRLIAIHVEEEAGAIRD